MYFNGNARTAKIKRDRYLYLLPPGGGGVLDVSLVGEVRRGPSYPDPV